MLTNTFCLFVEALLRERDELLALVDVQERNRYLRSRSISSEEAYCDYTTTEVR